MNFTSIKKKKINQFLKVSCKVKSEILSINFSYCYLKIHCLILWMDLLPKQGIFTSCIDHLKNSGPLEVYGVAQSRTWLKWLSSSSSRGHSGHREVNFKCQYSSLFYLFIYIYIYFNHICPYHNHSHQKSI